MNVRVGKSHKHFFVIWIDYMKTDRILHRRPRPVGEKPIRSYAARNRIRRETKSPNKGNKVQTTTGKPNNGTQTERYNPNPNWRKLQTKTQHKRKQ